MNEAKRNELNTPSGSVFVVSDSWDDMKPPSWRIKAVFADKESAIDAIKGYPKTVEETGFEPMKYKIDEFPVISPNAEVTSEGKHIQEFSRSTKLEVPISKTPPWVDMQKFLRICKSAGLDTRYGEENNRYDGGVHVILESGGTRYDLKANLWNGNSAEWKEVMEFLDSRKPLIR